MDNKNDDSAGSDSLDKSLQRKCVVDDMGQGEGNAAGVSSAAMTQPAQGCSEMGENKKKTETELDDRTANSMKKQKTEKSVGDGLAAGGGGIGAASVLCETDGNATKQTKAQTLQEGSLVAATVVASVLTDSTTSESSRTASDSSSSSASSIASNTTTNNSSSNAFESKVKQISKNLKETTLAESAHKKASLEDSSSTSSTASSASSTSSTPESEQTAGVACAIQACNSSSKQLLAAASETAAEGNQLTSSESIDEHDHRSKKVRFHPDVKENDGGNRVIPKKKKKFKASLAGGTGIAGGAVDEAAVQRAGEEEMELDEEEEVEEEEEFDLAKTIAEAQDYLKAHPLTFVRPYDKKSGRLQNGLLEEEDLPQLSESSEEEDIYEHVAPENGVERILGKQIKCGKVEFLLRYIDKPGLCWESEEFICKHCPTLLSKYEENRERRQERLMRHVARRQNIRQRYTDF